MGIKNTLTDLNNILFETLERLNDDDLQGEQLECEMKRSEQISKIGAVIVKNAETQLKAIKHFDDYGRPQEKMPEMLEVK